MYEMNSSGSGDGKITSWATTSFSKRILLNGIDTFMAYHRIKFRTPGCHLFSRHVYNIERNMVLQVAMLFQIMCNNILTEIRTLRNSYLMKYYDNSGSRSLKSSINLF